MVVINKIPILFLANNKLNIDIKTSEINSHLFFERRFLYDKRY